MENVLNLCSIRFFFLCVGDIEYTRMCFPALLVLGAQSPQDQVENPRRQWLDYHHLGNMAPQQPSSTEEQTGELDEPESEGEKQGPGPSSDQDHPATCDAPDGGWGWVVLVATILVLALTLAFPACIGIFYLDLQEEFQASNSETSWVPSIMTSVLHAGGKNVI